MLIGIESLCQLKLNPWCCQIQSILEETLRAVGAKAMVVGHTPQPMGANWYWISAYPLEFLLLENNNELKTLTFAYFISISSKSLILFNLQQI